MLYVYNSKIFDCKKKEWQNSSFKNGGWSASYKMVFFIKKNILTYFFCLEYCSTVLQSNSNHFGTGKEERWHQFPEYSIRNFPV